VFQTHVVVELAIGVSRPRSRDATTIHEGVIELEVPSDASATALALADGTLNLTGSVMVAEQARATYERALEPFEPLDPALLEWTRARGDREVLTLRVAPLTPAGATATVTLQLPRAGGAGRVQILANAPSAIELSAGEGAADRLSIEGRRVRAQRGDGNAALAATARRSRSPIVVAFGAVTNRAIAGDDAPSTTFIGPSLSLVAAPTPRMMEDRWRSRQPRVPVVRIGQPVPKPSRTKAGLLRTIRLYLPRVRHCFQTAVQRDRKSQGTVTASWTITEAGAVEDPTVAGFGDEALDACITGVVAEMEFAPSAEGLNRINYPFTFSL
jgi:hypothetical protein